MSRNGDERKPWQSPTLNFGCKVSDWSWLQGIKSIVPASPLWAQVLIRVSTVSPPSPFFLSPGLIAVIVWPFFFFFLNKMPRLLPSWFQDQTESDLSICDWQIDRSLLSTKTSVLVGSISPWAQTSQDTASLSPRGGYPSFPSALTRALTLARYLSYFAPITLKRTPAAEKRGHFSREKLPISCHTFPSRHLPSSFGKPRSSHRHISHVFRQNFFLFWLCFFFWMLITLVWIPFSILSYTWFSGYFK